MPQTATIGRSNITEKLHDAAFLDEYGRLESLRAARYNTSFSVVLISLNYGGSADGEKRRDTRMPLGCPPALASAVTGAIVDSIRDCDVIGTSSAGNLLCLLPETDYFGSLVAIRKISRAIAGVGDTHPEVSATLAHATFPRDGRWYADLVAHAGRIAEQKKRSLWEERGMGRMLFWEIISEFYRGGIKGIASNCFDAGAGHELPASLLDRLLDQIIDEIKRVPNRKGIVYIHPRGEAASRSVAQALSSMPRTSAKVFVVAAGPEAEREMPHATIVPIDDERLGETSFVLFLSEDSGYALICRENWGGSYSCFHTSDSYLVEGLITKFQIEYSLQVQLG